MNTTQIDEELSMLCLKNKLFMTLKYYLSNLSQREFQCFNGILEFLRKKYTEPDDYTLIEIGIRSNMVKYYDNNPSYSVDATINMLQFIYSHKNKSLLIDLLNCIDPGIKISS